MRMKSRQFVTERLRVMKISFFNYSDQLNISFQGIDVPFNLPNNNACVDSHIKCPLVQGRSYVYEASFPVMKFYPRVDVDVRYELKDSEDKDIVCVLIPVKIN